MKRRGRMVTEKRGRGKERREKKEEKRRKEIT